MQRNIQVYKFGGASVRDANAVRNIAAILKGAGQTSIVVVVSAMGKMTNAFERLTKAYIERSPQQAQIFEEIKEFHLNIVGQLFDSENEVLEQLNDLFVEIDWILEEEPHDSYDYLYDQIVSVGEFLSTRIVSAFLHVSDIENQWLDIRDVLKTDNTHRQARVDWEQTRKLAVQHMLPVVEGGGMIVTQGFVGCTSENFTSTLGREGSDYTAAILSSCLYAVQLTIWKDVPGVLTADPKQFLDVTKIERLTYREATEMAYYGAKVIHPNTIKPLQNKAIPMVVRSFEHPEEAGTTIGEDLDAVLPPVIVLAEEQVLVHISSRDFSFVAEHHLSKLFGLFAQYRIKVNLMRNTAISFSVCCDDEAEKIDMLVQDLESEFKVVLDRGLKLLTVRHATESVLEHLLKDKAVYMEERFKDTVQCVMKDVATPKFK